LSGLAGVWNLMIFLDIAKHANMAGDHAMIVD
jgi:hypothetical protein